MSEEQNTPKAPKGATQTRAPTTRDCERCDLPLSGYTEAIDCRYCDPLCPIFGTHAHLWDGDEDEARAAYLAETNPAKPEAGS